MAARDPETGQFVAGAAGFSEDEIEYHAGHETYIMTATNLTGATGAGYGEGGAHQGIEIVDLAEVVDRDEIAQLIRAYVRILVNPLGTQTADGAGRMAVEISTGPTNQVTDLRTAGAINLAPGDDIGGAIDLERVDGSTQADDSADPLVRPMSAACTTAFSDGATGVGGGGDHGVDEVVAAWAPGSGPMLDARDEIFAAVGLEAQNISDGQVLGELMWRFEFLPTTR